MQPVSLQTAPPEGEWYPSLVLDFVEGQSLVVGVPSSRGEEVMVEPGITVGVELPLPDGLRRFTAQVRRREYSPPGLHLSWPESSERIQRRDNVRVPVEVKATIRPLRPDLGVPTAVAGVTSDLSAGGVRINVVDELPAGLVVEVLLELPGLGTSQCQARVLRSGPLPAQQAPKRVWLAMEFTEITEPVRRDITKVVFDIQREQMRRGH